MTATIRNNSEKP